MVGKAQSLKLFLGCAVFCSLALKIAKFLKQITHIVQTVYAYTRQQIDMVPHAVSSL